MSLELNFSGQIEFLDWGLIDYEEALKKQEELVDLVAEKKNPGFIIFCTHPPIVTLGRKTQAGDVFAWPGATREVSRGGRATYHGPSQLLIYPILNLDLENQKWPKRDIGYLLKHLEGSIVDILQDWNIQSVGKSLQSPSGEETGVWVENHKIASLGLGIKKWVSYHGAALNVDHDSKAFLGMNPCGFNKDVMTSMESIVIKKIDRSQLQHKLKIELQKYF